MFDVLWQSLVLILLNLVFIVLLLLVLTPLALTRRAAFAVMRRNFMGYFSNPTGYVFLCLFVMLTSVAAFWPHEFFTANLANLDQLSKWLPLILLVFIPAITMSLWAEEKRQGTDELLLTLPAGDFDIVIGKYLAAAAIFTVSLLFSQFSTFLVLVRLTEGNCDIGLFMATYLGYWMTGLAMLSLGMVASFLTSNLTVSFILGLIFNSLLVFLNYADTVIPSSSFANRVERWSIAGRFDDFGRGVISVSGLAYFAMVTGVGIYLSMVLIGRRHWSGGRDGQSLWAHYILRTLGVIIAVIGVAVLLVSHDTRADATQGQVSSLAPQTISLLRGEGLPKGADGKTEELQPVVVDAYLSARVPDEYVATKYNLVSQLKEFEQQSRGRVRVRLHDNLEPFSEEATLAEERFGIKKQSVTTRSRGALKDEDFILGAAFSSGPRTVVVPLFGNGTPVEYELIRSITTVGSKAPRKRLGVVKTDANLMGGFSFDGGQPRQLPKQLMIEELEKQYRVEEVDPTNMIEEGKFDVLLVVQPSSLGQQQLANVVDAVRRGQPTAIFEDPLPVISGVPGTNQPKPQQGMFGMGGPPPQKGDIRALWDAIGIKVLGDSGPRAEVPGTIVWQIYNPYPRFQLASIGPEMVFVREEAPGAVGAFNPAEPAVSNFEELLMLFPGGVLSAKQPDSEVELDFVELISTGDEASGTETVADYLESRGDPNMMAAKRGLPTPERYTLAAWIRPKVKKGDKSTDAAAAKETDKDNAGDNAGDKSADDKSAKTAADKPAPKGVNVIYVCDIDMLDSQFVALRNQPNMEQEFRFDNVAFTLNLIDAVAGDSRFLEIRKRKPRHSTLVTIEKRAAKARAAEGEAEKAARATYDEAVKEFNKEKEEASKKLQDLVEELNKQRTEGKQIDPGELEARAKAVQLIGSTATRRAEVKTERVKKELDHELERIRRERDQSIQHVQQDYKLWAALLPPIPPLLLGLVVWVRRRLREREGISRARLRI